MSVATRWIHRTFDEMTNRSEGRYRLLKFLLSPASVIYGLVIKGRNALYDRGILRSVKTNGPVVSVGNVEVGGTGKTPFVIALGEQLQPFAKIAVVSRGYGSLAEKRKEPLVVSSGDGTNLSAEECGDEPLLISRRLPSAIVVVGKDRIKGVKLAQKMGAEVVLLDDGMQHRRLKRDIEIALVTSRCERGRFLPAGVLRDEPKRLEKADFVIKTDGDTADVESVPVGAFSLQDGSLVSIEGKTVALFCGIARPSRFYESVKQLGGKIGEISFYADHEEFSSRALAMTTREFKEKGIELVLCTEKDSMKLEKHWEEAHLPLAALKIELRFKKNNDAWNALIDKIKEKL